MQASQTASIADPGTVYVKTASGRDEVACRNGGLSQRERRVLIVVDGQRTVAELIALFSPGELEAALPVLVEKGLVVAAGEPAHVAGSDETLRDAKDFMISVAQSCLGLLAADLVARIEGVEDVKRLGPVVGYWVAALRESRFGAHLGEHYLEQLRGVLSMSSQDEAVGVSPREAPAFVRSADLV